MRLTSDGGKQNSQKTKEKVGAAHDEPVSATFMSLKSTFYMYVIAR